MVTLGELKKTLSYNRISGRFHWKGVKGPGGVAGRDDGKGGMRVVVDGHILACDRLAWFWCHNGTWPQYELEHINGKNQDNRIANLRERLPEPGVATKPSKGPSDDLVLISVQTARPRGGFPGAVEQCYFVEDNGYVQLYNLDKMSMGPQHREKIPVSFTAREKAALMLRQIAGVRNSDFSRKLVYPTLRY